jgi:translation initiation factor IF-2
LKIYELSKELGKSNKELLAILNEKGMDVKSHLSSISDEQAANVRKMLSDTGKSEESKAQTKSEPHKKKFTAVFRPQNAQQHTGKAAQSANKQSGARVLSVLSNNDKKQNTGEQTKEKDVQIKAPVEEKTTIETKDKEDKKEAVQTKVTADTKSTEEAVKDIDNNLEKQKQTMQNEEKKEVKVRNVYDDMARREEEKRKESANHPKTQSDSRNRGQDRGHGDNKRGQGYRNHDNKNNDRRGSDGQRNNDRRGSDGQRNFGNRQQGNNPRYADRNSQGQQGQQRQGMPQRQNQDRPFNPNFRDKNSSGGQNFKPRNPRNDFFDKDKDEKPASQRQGGFKKSSQKDSVSSMDGSLAKKTSTTRVNKNNFKNQKNDKRHRTEDGPAKGKTVKHPFIMPVKPKVETVVEDIKEITIPEVLTIKDLASELKLQSSAIIKKLFMKGQIVTLNTEISFAEAEEIALEYDVICNMEEKVDVIEELLKEDEENEADLLPRPPVVCVMGHVDHGKTSLLDAIRKSDVTSHEAGGITQHIGAYMVKINGQPITFLDTPGHEAFTAMRMRGAQSTDIAILVVAADDGVMPQTVEAISHAKAAGVEIIVAVNKIDKPSANIDRVKQELSEYELIPEDWGGTTIFCPVSAHSKEGIEQLLEMIILASEVKELKANPNRKARGIVIEAKLDKGKGSVATVLVQKGTLHVGDFIAAGACSGKVRAMINDKGVKVKQATPSTPVEILGLDNVPNAGEVFVATENDKEAKAFAATFISENKNKLIEETKAKLSLDDLFTQIKAGNLKELPVIIKADVQGSVEAVKESLVKLSNEEVQVKVIHGGVGSINESDVALAAASNAIIIGFNVRPDATAKSSADQEKVDLRLYKVIYQAIEDVEAAMRGMLEPIYEEKVIGHAEVRQIFKASGVGTIAGSYVKDGKFIRGCKIRITRDSEQIYEGALASLKRFKDDVKEVNTGYECGLVFEKFNDVKEGDYVEAYDMVEVSRG